MQKARIQIVDDNDNIIGYKYREEIDYSKDIYRVSALWLSNSKGEVLIAQRKFTKKNDPGKWGPAVAGTLEEGDTYESNIYKEAQEELGVTGIKFQLGPKQRRTSPKNYFGQWYRAVIDWDINKFKIQEEEVEQIKWIPKDILIKDIKEHPEEYIPTMSKTIKLFQ